MLREISFLHVELEPGNLPRTVVYTCNISSGDTINLYMYTVVGFFRYHLSLYFIIRKCWKPFGFLTPVKSR